MCVWPEREGSGASEARFWAPLPGRAETAGGLRGLRAAASRHRFRDVFSGVCASVTVVASLEIGQWMVNPESSFSTCVCGPGVPRQPLLPWWRPKAAGRTWPSPDGGPIRLLSPGQTALPAPCSHCGGTPVGVLGTGSRSRARPAGGAPRARLLSKPGLRRFLLYRHPLSHLGVQGIKMAKLDVTQSTAPSPNEKPGAECASGRGVTSKGSL